MKEESAFFVNLLTRNVPTLCLITDSSQVGHSYHEQECVCLPARMWREGSVLEAWRLWRSNNYSCLDEVKFRQKPMKEASVYEKAPTYSLSRGRHWHFTRLRSFVTRHFLVLWHLFCPRDRWFFLSLLSPVFKFLFYFLFFFPPPHPCHPPSHTERSCFQSPSGLLFIKNQSTSQRGTFQTHAAPEANDEARVNIRVVKLWWMTKWIRIASLQQGEPPPRPLSAPLR